MLIFFIVLFVQICLQTYLFAFVCYLCDIFNLIWLFYKQKTNQPRPYWWKMWIRIIQNILVFRKWIFIFVFKKNNFCFCRLLNNHGFSYSDPNYEEFHKQYGQVLQHRHHRWKKFVGKHPDDVSEKSGKRKFCFKLSIFSDKSLPKGSPVDYYT